MRSKFLQHDRWLKMMRVTSVVFVLATALFSAAQAGSASGQSVLDQRLSLSVKEESLQQVLKRIQQLTNVNFSYKSADVDHADKVTFAVRDRELKQILHTLLTPAGLEYTVASNNIVIRKMNRSQAAEDVNISGKVKSDAGESLPGASIIVKGTAIGTTADADGSFTLRVPSDGVLVVSFIGFAVYEEVIGNKVYFDITMSPDISQLQDVVVVGYGTAKKSEVLGAVSSVSLREVSSRNYNTAADVLQGTVPGITVMNNGGDPTNTADIKIRGMGSMNSEGPLVILDGVIYAGAINSISPNDIESISVLKDAASAAIYGSRASGGVILINTRKGKSSSHVDVNYQQGFQQVGKKLKPLDAAGRADAANLATDNAGLPRIPAFDAVNNPSSRITKTNWMDEVFQTGVINNLDVSVDGGNAQSNYFVSGGYRRNEGILLNTESERYTARINSSHEIVKGARIGENVQYTFTDGQTGNTSSAYTGAIMGALYYPANATIYREDDPTKFGGVPEQYANAYGDLINPVAYLKRIDNRTPTSTLLVNPYLEVDIIKGLKFRSNWGLTQIRRNNKQFNVKVLEMGKIFDFNELYQRSYSFNSMLTEQTITYDTKVASDHNITVLAGWTYQRDKTESYDVKGTTFDNEDPAYRYIKNAKTVEPLEQSGDETILMSYLGRLNYSYKGKYMFTGVLRYDGTSKLISSNRWKTYPSVSVGWNIAEEGFMENVSLVSDLKLRASWGQIGNLGGLRAYPFAVGLDRTRAWIGQDPAIAFGYAETGLSNQSLVWETSEQKNIGLDFGLLKGQLSGSFDFFQKTNYDMLFLKVLPGTAGSPGGQWINGGDVMNKGFELGLTYRNNEGAFTYEVTANVAKVKNEVRAITEENKFQNVGSSIRTFPQANVNIIGSPLNSFYGYRTAGLFQSNDEAASYINDKGVRYQPAAVAGDFKFVDENNDGVIDNADRVTLGSPFPTTTYSLNANFGFKGFDLNLFFQGVYGNSIFNASRALGLNAGYGYNLLEESREAWTPQNPDATIPRLSMSDPNNNWTRISDFFIEDGSFLRLKNVTLGYTLPQALFSKVKLRMYVTAQNVFTITDYKGMDPEVGLVNMGADIGAYPLSKVYMAGINLKF